MYKILEAVLKEMGYQLPHPVRGDNSVFTTLILKKDTFNVICTIKIHNTLLFAENLDEALVNRLTTLLYNDIWFQDEMELKLENLEEWVEINYPSDEPDAKMLRMLNYIRSKTKYDGQKIVTRVIDLCNEESRRMIYMYNREEMVFYFNSLYDMGFIKYEPSLGVLQDLYITTSGLNKLIEEAKKNKSKNCFVAMSFDSSLRGVYDNGIFPAIKECGFEPLRIDDDNKIPNEFTINDAILSGIKKSEFIIADFTEHKKGVYFEAGYALGRGLKVIYTCREDEIDQAHFDTRNYPHIVWKDAEDLKKKLIDKIEVFIKA